MKKFLALAIITLFFSVYGANIAIAHPGRLDKNGGHTCRTNCAKWGLKYGQYHKHR